MWQQIHILYVWCAHSTRLARAKHDAPKLGKVPRRQRSQVGHVVARKVDQQRLIAALGNLGAVRHGSVAQTSVTETGVDNQALSERAQCHTHSQAASRNSKTRSRKGVDTNDSYGGTHVYTFGDIRPTQ